MTPSTERSIRTAVHGAIAAVATGAVVLPTLHGDPRIAALGAGFVAASAGISKLWAEAEDLGIIPAWLRSADDVSSVDRYSKEALGLVSAADKAHAAT